MANLVRLALGAAIALLLFGRKDSDGGQDVTERSASDLSQQDAAPGATVHRRQRVRVVPAPVDPQPPAGAAAPQLAQDDDGELLEDDESIESDPSPRLDSDNSGDNPEEDAE